MSQMNGQNPGTQTVWVVSGCNRGVGFGLAKRLSQEPDTIVYAGSRDLENATQLNELARERPGIVRPMCLVSGDVENNSAAAQKIDREVGKVDYMVANAGIGGDLAPLSELSIPHFYESFTVNTMGPIVLYQSLYPLLKKGNSKKIAVITSRGGAITECLTMNFGAYGVSKAAANYFTQKLGGELEGEGFVVLAMTPGFVFTDMMMRTTKKVGLDGWDLPAGSANDRFKAITIEESAEGLVSTIKKATREDARNFLCWNGTVTPW